MIKSTSILLIGLTVTGCATNFYYENDQKVEVTQLHESRSYDGNNSKKSVDYYKTSTGHKVGVTNEILVQCKTNVDCKKVIKEYEPLSIVALSDSIFLVSITEDKNVFEMSQILYSHDEIKLAHPNFIKEKKRR